MNYLSVLLLSLFLIPLESPGMEFLVGEVDKKTYRKLVIDFQMGKRKQVAVASLREVAPWRKRKMGFRSKARYLLDVCELGLQAAPEPSLPLASNCAILIRRAQNTGMGSLASEWISSFSKLMGNGRVGVENSLAVAVEIEGFPQKSIDQVITRSLPDFVNSGIWKKQLPENLRQKISKSISGIKTSFSKMPKVIDLYGQRLMQYAWDYSDNSSLVNSEFIFQQVKEIYGSDVRLLTHYTRMAMIYWIAGDYQKSEDTLKCKGMKAIYLSGKAALDLSDIIGCYELQLRIAGEADDIQKVGLVYKEAFRGLRPSDIKLIQNSPLISIKLWYDSYRGDFQSFSQTIEFMNGKVWSSPEFICAMRMLLYIRIQKSHRLQQCIRDLANISMVRHPAPSALAFDLAGAALFFLKNSKMNEGLAFAGKASRALKAELPDFKHLKYYVHIQLAAGFHISGKKELALDHLAKGRESVEKTYVYKLRKPFLDYLESRFRSTRQVSGGAAEGEIQFPRNHFHSGIVKILN